MSKYWMYVKYLCFWLVPCSTITDVLPDRALDGNDLTDYWIDMFDKDLSDPWLLPK